MSEYAKPPEQEQKKGRDAFAGNVRSYQDGYAAGWCEALADVFAEQDDGSDGAAALRAVFAEELERRGWLELLRKACRKRGVEL